MNMSIFTKVSYLSFNFSGELEFSRKDEVTIEAVIDYLNQDLNNIPDFIFTINKLHHGYKDTFVKVIKKGDNLECHGDHTILLLFLNKAYYKISGKNDRSINSVIEFNNQN